MESTELGDLLCHESMPVLRTWTTEDSERFLRQIETALTPEVLAAMTAKACLLNAFVNGDCYGYTTFLDTHLSDAVCDLLRGAGHKVATAMQGSELVIGIDFSNLEPPSEEEEDRTPAPSPVAGAKRSVGGDEEEEHQSAKAVKENEEEEEDTVVLETQE